MSQLVCWVSMSDPEPSVVLSRPGVGSWLRYFDFMSLGPAGLFTGGQVLGALGLWAEQSYEHSLPLG